jgi:hypothetical protein
MILTPIPEGELSGRLARLRAGLSDAGARRALDRILGSGSPARAAGEMAERHRQEALALARRFGMGAAAGLPVSWDGRALRSDTEAYVLLHEIAHFQLAGPGRRGLVDFGLGPGPDTEDRAAAEACARLFGADRDREEAAASLLGILWEAELGHPALASFVDQNWLEGGDRAAAHFMAVLDALRDDGCITPDGRPIRPAPLAADAAARALQESPLRGPA